MKKLILVYCPGASPTTVPLGVCSLTAYIRINCNDVEVRQADLSIGMRLSCFDNTEEANLALPFFTGQLGNFFDSSVYSAYQSELFSFFERWRAEERALSEALSKDFVSVEVEQYASRLDSLITLTGEEIVALSAAFPEQVLHAVFIAKILKRKHPELTILLGGSALSVVDVDDLLAAVPELDFIFRGEGEIGLSEFLKGIHPSLINGFSFRINNITKSNPAPTSVRPEMLPSPDLSDLSLKSYLNPVPVVPVLFSRGCKWRKCRFCSHNFSFSGYRKHSFECFVNTLSYYKLQNGISMFYIADQYISAEDLLGISEEILRQNLDIRFHVMGRPSNDYSPKVLETAFAAGCRWISWGAETFSSRLLDICNKGTNPTDIVQVLKNSKKAGISNLAMMIFGLPGSNDFELQQTLDTASNVSDVVDAFTSSCFQLFEHTPFFKRAEEFGLIPEERETLFIVSGKPVHSYRRSYSIRLDNGGRALPQAAVEAAKWKQWQLFVRGGESFFESLPAEHYLLFAAKFADGEFTFRTPTKPSTPRPLRRAG